jgi:hypothetical protein
VLVAEGGRPAYLPPSSSASVRAASWVEHARICCKRLQTNGGLDSFLATADGIIA